MGSVSGVGSNRNFDVVVMGGGPIGLLEACVLKSLNRDLKICVLEGREEITRDFGLSISAKSIKPLVKILDKGCHHGKNVDQKSLQELKSRLKEWSSLSSVRTNRIQTELAQKAHSLGIEILRGNAYRMTSESMTQLFNAQSSSEELSPELQCLKPQLEHAKMIIGADGSHSVVRQTVMGPDEENLTDRKTYAYALEMKYEIAVKKYRRSAKWMTRKHAYAMGGIVTQIVGKGTPIKVEEKKSVQVEDKEAEGYLRPVTDLVFVDEDVHQAFLKKDQDGNVLKGSPGKGWSLEELQTLAKTDTVVREYLHKIQRQKEETEKYYGIFKEVEVKSPQITTLPLATYRSKSLVKLFQGKMVVLLGDSSSGLILRRGLNKGLMEVALNAERVLESLETSSIGDYKAVPESLINYERQAQKLFANEKWWIALKTRILSILKFPIKYFFHPIYKMISSMKFQVKKLLAHPYIELIFNSR